MPVSDEWAASRLANFYSVQFLPALEQARHAFDSKYPLWLRPAQVASFFEAVCWLAMGKSCGYFPVKDSNSVLKRYIYDLRNLYDRYVADSLSGFTPALLESIRRITVEQNLVLEFTVERSEGTYSAFSDLLVTSRRLNHDDLAEICCLAVSFQPSAFWDGLRNEQLLGTGLYTALTAEPEVDKDYKLVSLNTLAAGALQVLEHMERSYAYFTTLQRVSAQFAMTAGMLQAWRLQVGDLTRRERFMFLVRVIAQSMHVNEVASRKVDELKNVRMSFVGHAEYLVTAWNAHHPMWLAAEARG